MAVAFRAAGTAVEAEATQVTLSPAGGGSNGELLIALIQSDNVAGVASASGWTQFDSQDGNLLQKYSLLWKIANGTEANTEFVLDGTACFGVILAFTGTLASGTPIGTLGLQTKATASATVTGADVDPAANDNGIVFCAFSTRVAGVTTCSAYSGTNPTFTEVFDGGAASALLSLNFSIAVALGVQTTSAATGARTATLSAAPAENQGVMFCIKPVAAAGGADSKGLFFFFNK